MNFENEYIKEKFYKMYGIDVQILEKQEESYRKLEKDFIK